MNNVVKKKLPVGILYRRALKSLKSFFTIYDEWFIEARKVRDEFDAHKNETDPDKIEFLYERAKFVIDEEYKLEQNIVLPDHFGGTAYMRVPPLSVDYI